MAKSTDSSVTNVRCSCRSLERALADGRFPVRFDDQVNEYYFDHTLPTGEKLSIRLLHCPACGGIASKSTRDTLFADLSKEEMQRIHRRVGDLHSVVEIERALGAPDADRETGANFGAIRTLTYRRLSKTADVQFSIFADGRIEGAIAPKQVRLKPGISPKRKSPKRNKKKKMR